MTDPRAVKKVIRDPVHDYVEVQPELLPVINHPFVQRLRRISQTSMSSTVYPSMTGRRFEHSLGAMHLAAAAWRSAWSNTRNETRVRFRSAIRDGVASHLPAEDDKTVAAAHYRNLLNPECSDIDFQRTIEVVISAAALLHDVGHTPFSHALEEWYSYYLEWIIKDLKTDSSQEIIQLRDRLTGTSFHEVVGVHLLSRVEESTRNYLPWDIVVAILTEGLQISPLDSPLRHDRSVRTWIGCLHELISGEVDVDRLDYLVRDARNAGTEFGTFDIARLIHSLELHYIEPKEASPEAGPPDVDIAQGWFIGFGAAATSALEIFITQRYQYYRWVVYHQHVIAANRMLKLCVHYLLRMQGVIAEDGVIDLSKTSGAKLDYFAAHSGPPSSKQSRAIAAADDGTIIEWIKSELAVSRHIADGSGDSDKPVHRFVALADTVIHRTSNWIALWKTDGEYRALCDRIYPALEFACQSARLKFDIWKVGKPAAIVAIGERRLLELITLIDPRLSSQEVPRQSVPYTPSGPAPFMNKLAEVTLSADSPLANIRFRREIDAANLFSTIVGNIEGHADGFWVFAYDSINPWRLGDTAAKVFRDEAFVPLSEQSGHALHWLEGVEAERAQFHCYFVSPHVEHFTGADSELIRRRFVAAFPNYIFNLLQQIFCVTG